MMSRIFARSQQQERALGASGAMTETLPNQQLTANNKERAQEGALAATDEAPAALQSAATASDAMSETLPNQQPTANSAPI